MVTSATSSPPGSRLGGTPSPHARDRHRRSALASDYRRRPRPAGSAAAGRCSPARGRRSVTQADLKKSGAGTAAAGSVAARVRPHRRLAPRPVRRRRRANQYDVAGDVIHVYAPIPMAPLLNDRTGRELGTVTTTWAASTAAKTAPSARTAGPVDGKPADAHRDQGRVRQSARHLGRHVDAGALARACPPASSRSGEKPHQLLPRVRRASAGEAAVERDRLVGDRAPAELLDGAAAAGAAHRRRAPGIGEQLVHPRRERRRRSAAGSTGSPRAPSSTGTSRPVSPSTTTSGMPPTAEATTAVSHAIASRFTIPSGS